MSRFYLSTLNFVSERDPDEIVQTHMLSWAIADHICRKYQQGLGTVQVDFMLGSELCSRKEHTHRMIEVSEASADSETILPNWEIL